MSLSSLGLVTLGSFNAVSLAAAQSDQSLLISQCLDLPVADRHMYFVGAVVFDRGCHAFGFGVRTLLWKSSRRGL